MPKTPPRPQKPNFPIEKQKGSVSLSPGSKTPPSVAEERPPLRASGRSAPGAKNPKRGDLVAFWHAKRFTLARVLHRTGKTVRVSVPTFGRVDLPVSRVQRCSAQDLIDVQLVGDFMLALIRAQELNAESMDRKAVLEATFAAARAARGGQGGRS